MARDLTEVQESLAEIAQDQWSEVMNQAVPADQIDAKLKTAQAALDNELRPIDAQIAKLENDRSAVVARHPDVPALQEAKTRRDVSKGLESLLKDVLNYEIE